MQNNQTLPHLTGCEGPQTFHGRLPETGPAIPENGRFPDWYRKFQPGTEAISRGPQTVLRGCCSLESQPDGQLRLRNRNRKFRRRRNRKQRRRKPSADGCRRSGPQILFDGGNRKPGPQIPAEGRTEAWDRKSWAEATTWMAGIRNLRQKGTRKSGRREPGPTGPDVRRRAPDRRLTSDERE